MKRQLITMAVVLLVVAAAGTVLSGLYVVRETEQGVIVQFGRPVGDPVDEAGLHFKLPFVQEFRRFDKRALAWDGDPNQVPTKGREFISIDTTARWRIKDPLQFMKSVRDETGAQSRLDDVIDSVVRDEVSSTGLTDIVRSTDWEVTERDLEKLEVVELQDDDKALTGEVQVGREELTRSILSEAKKNVEQYGIELIDVRIKRINYIPSVQERVFGRMISERQRIAEQFRSEGRGEASRIQGETEKQLAIIRSEAVRQAEVIRGQADAEATTIYNEAYAAEPEFYSFYRTLESYEKTLGEDTVMILNTNAEYLRYLQDIGGR